MSIAIGGLLIWAMSASHEANRQHDRATEQAELAASRRLAASAKDVSDAEGDLALDLAVAARRMADNQESAPRCSRRSSAIPDSCSTSTGRPGHPVSWR